MDRSRVKRVAKVFWLTAATALTTTLTVPAAMAQDDSLQEVIVTTARQREEALQDVPAAITAFTSATLEAAAVERAGDFIRLTPGVSFVQSAEVADSQVNIRGINGARDAENSYALIVDGILLTNPAALNREYSDLKQMEIVKGPQGAIYGRNAASGAIIVTTAKPTDSFSGDAKIGFGEDNTQTAAITLSGPLSDTAAWKMHADYRKTDGFYRNTFLNNNSVDDFEGWNVDGRLIFEPTDSSKLDFKLHYGKVDAAAISFNAAFQLPGFTFAPLPNAALFNENVNNHKFDFVNNIDPFNEQETLEFSAKWDNELSFGNLTAWALYSKVDNAFGSDGTSGAFNFFSADAFCQNSSAAFVNAMGSLPPPQIIFFAAPNTPPAAIFGPYTPTGCDGTQYQERNQTDYSFEVRLASSGDQALRWLAGLYYLNIDREVGVNTGVDRGNGITRSLFVPRAAGANQTENLVWDNFTTDVAAVFGNLAYDVNDSFEVALALRYDQEKRKTRSLVPTTARTQYIDFTPDQIAGGGAFLNPGLDPRINPSGLTPKSRTFEQLQPKFTLTYEPSPNLTTYASWGVGFKSGGFNNGGSAATVDIFINCLAIAANNNCLNAANVPFTAAQLAGIQRSVRVRDTFEKEKSSSAELGLKGKAAEGKFTYDLSVYDTTVDNMQFFEFFVGQFGLLRLVNNIDKVDIQGVEAAIGYSPTDALKLVAGYSRISSEIKANSSRPRSVGNESPYTPDYTATVGAELDVPVGETWGVQASAYLNIVGPTWFHVIQAQDNPTFQGPPGNYTKSEREKYSTVDARFALVSDKWTIALVGKNVTDEQFLQEVIPAPEFGGDFIHPGSQRRLSLEVGYKF